MRKILAVAFLAVSLSLPAIADTTIPDDTPHITHEQLHNISSTRNYFISIDFNTTTIPLMDNTYVLVATKKTSKICLSFHYDGNGVLLDSDKPILAPCELIFAFFKSQTN